jgi:hypothetical protein
MIFILLFKRMVIFFCLQLYRPFVVHQQIEKGTQTIIKGKGSIEKEKEKEKEKEIDSMLKNFFLL